MRKDVQAIFIRSPCAKQVMMFSATLNKDLRTVCKRFMSDVNIFNDLVFLFWYWKCQLRGGLGLKSIIFNICIHYSRFPRRVLCCIMRIHRWHFIWRWKCFLCMPSVYSSINLDIALKPFDDSSLEKVLTGHSNENSTCSLLNYDFLSGHPKVFLSEAALNRMTDLEWMQAIMLKSSMT